MLPALLIGIFSAAAMTVAVAAFNRAPTRSHCPECLGRTRILLLPPILRRNEFVHLRWCPRCDWEGLGRNGPDWVRGRRLAHDSGFHWGDERFQADFGFKFRHTPLSEEPPPHHPSGFRFVENAEPEPPAPHHPSGFRFSQEPEDAAEDRGTGPLTFPAEPQASGFRFKDTRDSDDKKGGGFIWKGVA
jgi:hypothetical protein